MEFLIDLDQYFKNYCDYWCNLNGGSCDSIYYSFPGYALYQTQITEVNTSYTDTPAAVISPLLIKSYEFTNDSSNQNVEMINSSTDFTNTYSWTLRESFKIGIDVRFEVGVPPIASGETSVTRKINSSDMEENTSTELLTFTINHPVNVPPNSRVTVSSFIDLRSLSQTFYTSALFSQSIASMSPKPVLNHLLWFHQISDIFTQFPMNNFTVSGSQVSYQGSGIFDGLMAFRTRLEIAEYALGSNEPTQTYTVMNPINCAGVADMEEYYSQLPCVNCLCPCLPPS